MANFTLQQTGTQVQQLLNLMQNLNISNGSGTGSIQQKDGNTTFNNEYPNALEISTYIQEISGEITITPGTNKTILTATNGAYGSTSTLLTGKSLAHGSRSLAHGTGTIAIGDYSHSEGNATIAKGKYSHAEGISSLAIGNGCHAEGSACIANGLCSHAEGLQCKTSGNYSYAGGEGCQALKANAFAFGSFNLTRRPNSVVFGKFNKTLTDNQDWPQLIIGKFNNPETANLFEIGNGTAEAYRRNAFAITKEGYIKLPNYPSESSTTPDGYKTFKCVNGTLTRID